MNDERCDRDRVTAILALADELRPQLKVMLGRECPVWEEQFDAGAGFVIGLPDAATVAARFCAGRLLEALDTIDRLEGEKEKLETLVLCVDSELAQTTIAIPGTYGMLTKAARRIRQRLINGGNEPISGPPNPPRVPDHHPFA